MVEIIVESITVEWRVKDAMLKIFIIKNFFD